MLMTIWLCTLLCSVQTGLINHTIIALEKTLNALIGSNLTCTLETHYSKAFLKDITNCKHDRYDVILSKIDKVTKKTPQQFNYIADYVTMDKPINFSNTIINIPEFNIDGIVYEDRIRFYKEKCFKNIMVASNTDGECNLDVDCLDYFSDHSDIGYGKQINLKLMYIQSLKTHLCLIDESGFQITVEYLCSMLYQETIYLFEKCKLTSRYDIFLESIMICAYEGYKQFMNKRFLQLVLLNQEDDGCFNLFFDEVVEGDTKTMKLPKPREEKCDAHTTCLAMGVLSAFYSYIHKKNK